MSAKISSNMRGRDKGKWSKHIILIKSQGVSQYWFNHGWAEGYFPLLCFIVPLSQHGRVENSSNLSIVAEEPHLIQIQSTYRKTVQLTETNQDSVAHQALLQSSLQIVNRNVLKKMNAETMKRAITL